MVPCWGFRYPFWSSLVVGLVVHDLGFDRPCLQPVPRLKPEPEQNGVRSGKGRPPLSPCRCDASLHFAGAAKWHMGVVPLFEGTPFAVA